MANEDRYSSLIEACESEIRSGRIDLAIQRLQRLDARLVPPRYRQTLAALCRRTGLIHHGLKILTPTDLVDREHWLRTVGSAEAAEYGALIQRVGSTREAIDILSAINAEECPDSLLFLSFCHLARWEPAKAVELLERYARAPLNEYKSLLARVNLASALAGADELVRASELLEKILREAGDNVRLRANCLETSARVAMDRGDLDSAEEFLASAATLLGSSGTTDRFLIDKAFAIVMARRQNDISPLKSIRARAIERRDWESARDLDLHRLRIEFDPEAFAYLYFGTPFEGYRSRVVKLLGVSAPKEAYALGDGGGREMNLKIGSVDDETRFREGGKIHRTLFALFRDLYRPVQLGDLFAELHPGEHFDVFTSPDRVYQSVMRTRKFLAKMKLPIAIVESQGAYAFEIKGSIRLQIAEAASCLDWNEVQFAKLAIEAHQEYSAREIREKLGLGLSPFWRFADWAVTSGRLERVGRGPALKYRIPSKQIRQAA